MPGSPTDDRPSAAAAEPGAESARLRWFHWLVLCASLGLTLAAWRNSDQQLRAGVHARFDAEAEQIVELVVERMRKYEDALWGGVGAIQAHGGHVTLSQWRAFAGALRIDARYPGISGIGVIERVPAGALPAYEAAQRSERPHFRVYPPRPRASEHYPIVYILPEAQNLAAVGLDIGHERNRLRAAERARDTGTPQVTAPIVLVQDADKTPGFLFYTPYYRPASSGPGQPLRERFLGFVYAPFLVRELMEGTLARGRRHVTFRISDGSDVLYDEHIPNTADFDPDPAYRKQVSVAMYGRQWRFDLHSARSFPMGALRTQPLTILAAGIALDLLMLAGFLLLSRANRRALANNRALADSVTLLDRTARDLEAAKAGVVRREGDLRQQRRAAMNIAADAKLAQQRAEEAERRAAVTVESAPSAMVMVDGQGVIVLVNAEAERMFGHTRVELLGQPIEVLVPSRVRGVHGEHRDEYIRTPWKRSMGRGQVLHGLRKDGTEFPIEVGLNPIETSRGRFVLSAIVDNTERDRTADALRHRSEEMEQLLYTVSHDLKSPLVTIEGFAGLIEQALKRGDVEDAQDSAVRVSRGARKMGGLISGLLDLSRIGGEGEAPQEVDVGAVVAELVDSLSLQLQAADASVVVDNPLPRVHTVLHLLQHILQNLVDNALKYACTVPPATIHIGHEDHPRHHAFYVRDRGPGIADGHAERVFQVFRRIGKGGTGTGLGLAIVRKATRSLGGNAWVEAAPGQGACFWFTIAKRGSQDNG